MSAIRRLIAFLWKAITWIRIGLANLLFILLIIVVMVAIKPKQEVVMPDQIALRIAPSGFLVDQYSYVDPVTQIINNNDGKRMETLTRDVVKAIDHGANDDRITAILLELDELDGGGLSKIREIGSALERFKASGKSVYAVSDNFSQDQYLLASYADEIIMHPLGTLLITGYGSYRQYYKSLLDKLQINMHVFRAGEYKDAVEPYLRDDMSEASREHNSRWVSELWQHYSTTVETQRQLPGGSLNLFVNQMDRFLAANGGNSAQTALQLKLIDTLATHPQQEALLIEKLGEDDHQSYRALDHFQYLRFIKREQLAMPHKDKVALIVARGMILDGDHPPGTIGSETMSELIQQAREDDRIKALVLRVDSGGGSAFASEVIRQQLLELQSEGKPVLISMGSVAASGGYWIGMGAQEVWATPTTITGSIGVFSALPTLENSFESIGIHTDGVSSTELGGSMRLDRPLPPLAQRVLQQSVNNIYQRFLSLVADARNSTTDQIHQVAQGRVWTGEAAVSLGLVDHLGNLNDVIEAAAQSAGLTDYDIEEMKRPLSPAEQLAQEITQKLVRSGVRIPAAYQSLSGWLTQVGSPLKEAAELIKAHPPMTALAHCLECQIQ